MTWLYRGERRGGKTADIAAEESRRRTAEFLGLSEDDVSYIDEESLDRGAVPVLGDADGGGLYEEEQEARSVAAAAQPVIVNARVTPNQI